MCGLEVCPRLPPGQARSEPDAHWRSLRVHNRRSSEMGDCAISPLGVGSDGQRDCVGGVACRRASARRSCAAPTPAPGMMPPGGLCPGQGLHARTDTPRVGKSSTLGYVSVDAVRLMAYAIRHLGREFSRGVVFASRRSQRLGIRPQRPIKEEQRAQEPCSSKLTADVPATGREGNGRRRRRRRPGRRHRRRRQLSRDHPRRPASSASRRYGCSTPASPSVCQRRGPFLPTRPLTSASPVSTGSPPPPHPSQPTWPSTRTPRRRQLSDGVANGPAASPHRGEQRDARLHPLQRGHLPTRR